MAQFVAVDHDPFDGAGPSFVPIDHNPFMRAAQPQAIRGALAETLLPSPQGPPRNWTEARDYAASMNANALRASPGELAMALAGGPRMRAFHNSNNPAKVFAAHRARTGNTFGPGVYVAPEPNKAFGRHTYELEVGGRPASVNVDDPADIARFNRQFGMNMQAGGYFDREVDAAKLPNVLKKSGFDRLDVMAGGRPMESVVFDPSMIEIMKKFGLAGLLGGNALASPFTDNR